MSAQALLKLVQGILVVAIIVTIGFILKYERQASILSDTAVLRSGTYVAGIGYTGVITEMYVREGQSVERGDTLLLMESPSLIERLNSAELDREDVFYELNENNQIILKAEKAGVVDVVHFNQGSFVSGNSEIITLKDQEYRVEAEVTIPESDFNFVREGMPLTIYIGRAEFSATLANIEVNEVSDSVVFAQIVARPDDSSELTNYPSGSPARVELRLRDSLIPRQ